MTKTIAMTSAALMVAMALAPLASAHSDGNIGRTFVSHGEIAWKPQSNGVYGGVGWYAPNNPDNLCLVSLYGLAFSAGFYYETGRIMLGDLPNIHVADVGEIEIVAEDAGCPAAINPGGAADSQWIGSSELNVYVSPGISQSHLLCSSVSTAVFCNPDADSASWTIRVCEDAMVAFDQGDFLLLGLPVSVMSSRLDDASDCAAAGVDYDVSSMLNPLNGRQSSFPELHLNQIAELAPGQPSSDVISCFDMSYDRISIAGTDVAVPASSHDYFLVLNDAANEVPVLWANYLANHLNAPSGGPNLHPIVVPAPLSVALNGFYDLSGDNDSPCGEGGEIDAKSKASPQVDLNPFPV